MLHNRSSWNLAKFLIPAVLIFSTTYYLFHSEDPISIPGYVFTNDPSQPPHPPGHQDALVPQAPIVTKEQLKQEFIQDVISHEVDGPMNLAPLTELCSATDWQPGLIVKCQPVPGGIGNIRNMFLNCIRFALEAGGSSFVPCSTWSFSD